MKSNTKHIGNAFLGVFVFLSAVLVFISLPFISYAQTGTLGQDSPEIFCVYEQDGVAVDGNYLKAGTYNVSFMLSDISSLSVFEVTATYDTEQVTIESTPSALISNDEAVALDSMGYILSDGNIVFGFVSTDDSCSVLTESEYVLATVTMTFASDCDAADYIKISQNPNLTFAQADYGDGYDDAYALVENFEDYNGALSLMKADVTPSFGFNVSGELVIMVNSDGSTNGTPTYGEYTVDVYSDSDRTDLVTSVTSVYAANTNNEIKNTFNINNLTNGTYYATISSEYSMPRDITIVVSGKDISAGAIPMICCDFDQDKVITAGDAKSVYIAAGTGQLREYCELDGDGAVGASDAKIVYIFSASSRYDTLIIE